MIRRMKAERTQFSVVVRCAAAHNCARRGPRRRRGRRLGRVDRVGREPTTTARQFAKLKVGDPGPAAPSLSAASRPAFRSRRLRPRATDRFSVVVKCAAAHDCARRGRTTPRRRTHRAPYCDANAFATLPISRSGSAVS